MFPDRSAIPRLPGGPDPNEPVPRDPVEGVDLDGYARVAAALAASPRARARVLGEHRLDELRWMTVEKTWLLRAATAAMQGDAAFGADLDRAQAAAQAALTAPATSLAEYAVLAARIESGEPPPAVLASAGLSAAAFGQLARTFAAAMATDPEKAAAYQRAVAAHRAKA